MASLTTATLSQDIKQTLADNSYDRSTVSVYSNTWLTFLGYLMNRNRGYGFRKIYNLLTEVFEIGCLAYLIDTHLLKSLLILPLMNIASGYLQEYHNQLYRGTRNHNLNRIFIAVITLLLTTGLATITYQQANLHNVFILLFAFRCIVIFSQSYFNIKNIDFLAFNRLRPNIKAMWVALFSAAIASGFVVLTSLHPILKIIIVSFFFSVARWVPEFIYFRMAQAKIYSLRYISYLKKNPPEPFKNALNEVIFIFVHLTCLICFSFKFKNFNAFESAGLTFLILTFYDRLINRPFKSMSLDLLRLFSSRQRNFTMRLLNRLALITTSLFIVCIGTLVWTAKFSKEQLIVLGLIFTIFMFHNYLLSTTQFKNVNKRNRFLYMYMGACLFNVLLLFTPLYSPILFILVSSISLVIGFMFAFKGNSYIGDDNRLSYTEKNPFFKKQDFQSYTVFWENFNNQWLRFLEENKKINNYYIHFNRKVKIFYTKNSTEFLKLANEFALNVDDVVQNKSALTFTHPKKLEGGQLVYLDDLGFWITRDGKKFKAEESILREMHIFNSHWINRYVFSGGKTDIAVENHEFRIAHFSGNVLWHKKKVEAV